MKCYPASIIPKTYLDVYSKQLLTAFINCTNTFNWKQYDPTKKYEDFIINLDSYVESRLWDDISINFWISDLIAKLIKYAHEFIFF